MAMKTWIRVGKSLEYGLYLAILAAFVKILSSMILGVYYHTALHSGPEVYCWRIKFQDKDISRSTFSPIATNAERKDDLFNTYIDTVQPQSISKTEKAIIEKQKNNVDLTPDETGKLDTIKYKQTHNKLGFYPLYARTSFSDAFILNPKKSFKIFKNEENNLSFLEKEFEFLAFRMFFIEYMLTINNGAKSYTPLTKANITSFIKSFSKLSGSVADKDKLVSLSPYLSNKEGKNTISVHIDHAKAIANYCNIHDDFSDIIKKMVEFSKNKEGDKAIFSIGKDNYSVIVADKDVMTGMINILNSLGLSDIMGFEDDESIKIGINNFFTSVALIKPTILTAHILNRIYYYFLFTHSYLCTDEELSKYGSGKEEYSEYIKNLADIKTVLDDNKDDKSIIAEYTNRKNILVKKMYEIRNNKIFNYFSYLLAMNLPGHNIYLNKENNKRLPILNLFAYPDVFETANEDDIKLYEHLNTQIVGSITQ